MSELLILACYPFDQNVLNDIDYFIVDQTLALMEKAVVTAGEHIIQASSRREVLNSWEKTDATLVTALDLECDEIITKLLTTFPVMTEEQEGTHDLLHSKKQYFLVDPVDGTTACKRFLSDIGGQVGFGPLIGFIEEGRLTKCTFFNVPQRTIFTASRGEGTWMQKIGTSERIRLSGSKIRSLKDSAIIFFTGRGGEAKVAEQLKLQGYVQTTFRFGGFANDCSRVARGFEEIQMQSIVKPWDYSAVLLSMEAGLKTVVDPFGDKIPFDNWQIQMNNPVLTANSESVSRLLEIIGDASFKGSVP